MSKSLLYGLLLAINAGGVAAQTLTLSQIADDPITDSGMRIVNEAYHRLGIMVKAELLPPERAISYADQGKTDGDVARLGGFESSYHHLQRVPVPLMYIDILAYTAGRQIRIENWQSLRPYRLCVRNGIKVMMDNTEGMARELVDNTDQAVKMLRARRCDIAILSNMAWLDIDRLQAGPMRALKPALSVIPLYHYLNEEHADLIPQLSTVLQQMRSDGSISRIRNQDERAMRTAQQRQSVPDD